MKMIKKLYMYYKNNVLLSYAHYFFYLIIGARGIGKTFMVKSYCIKQFLKKGTKFIWLRDNENAIKELTGNNSSKKFTSDIEKENIFNSDINFKIKCNTLFINGVEAGLFMSISTFYNKKGSTFNEYDIVVFDEFIPETSQKRYASRVNQFVNTIETIGRLRTNLKVFMLANALNKGDEILDIFNFKIKDFGYYKNKSKKAILHYCENSNVFNEKKSKSLSGILIKNTIFEDSILKNKFNGDENEFFIHRPAGLKLFCILHSTDSSCRVYHKKGGLYVIKDFNINTCKDYRYACEYQLINTFVTLLPNDYLDILKNKFTNGEVRFENSFVKNTFIEVIKRK